MLIEISWEQETQDRVFCATSYGKSKVEFGDCNSEIPIQEILKPIFKAKAIKAAENPDSYPDVTISDFAEEKGPLIRKFNCKKSAEGYNWILIINDEAEASYEENVKFPTFDGMTLLPPEEGSSYSLTCGPGQWRMVIIRCEPSFSMSMSYSHKVTQGSSALISECLAEGTPKERAPGIN
jgi:hypothetical protein